MSTAQGFHTVMANYLVCWFLMGLSMYEHLYSADPQTWSQPGQTQTQTQTQIQTQTQTHTLTQITTHTHINDEDKF